MINARSNRTKREVAVPSSDAIAGTGRVDGSSGDSGLVVPDSYGPETDKVYESSHGCRDKLGLGLRRRDTKFDGAESATPIRSHRSVN